MVKKIGFIGCGNMSTAILSGALLSGVIKKEDIYVYDISAQALKKISELGVNISNNNEELCKQSDLIILAVKPQATEATLNEIKHVIGGKALLSIVAGITAKQLSQMAGNTTRILRNMPNTPAMVSAGAFAMCSDNTFTEEEQKLASDLFEAIGIVEWVPEKLIDAVCGLSGGGPAYVAMFIEALADGGVKQGLPRATAYRLASQTVMGTAKLALELNLHPGILKDMVTSPGGTTIEGCEALERGGMRFAVMDCVRAATEKSIRLGKGELL